MFTFLQEAPECPFELHTGYDFLTDEVLNEGGLSRWWTRLTFNWKWASKPNRQWDPDYLNEEITTHRKLLQDYLKSNKVTQAKNMTGNMYFGYIQSSAYMVTFMSEPKPKFLKRIQNMGYSKEQAEEAYGHYSENASILKSHLPKLKNYILEAQKLVQAADPKFKVSSANAQIMDILEKGYRGRLGDMYSTYIKAARAALIK